MTDTNQTAAVDGEGFIKTDAPILEPGVSNPPPPPEQQFEMPQKRKRGRPSNAEKMAAQGIPAGSASTPKAKAAKAKVSYTQTDFAQMGKQLVGLHKVVAMATGIPFMQIDDTEGLALAQAIGNVAEQYDLEIDGKTGAALQLLMTAGMIYGPRLMMFQAAKKQAASQPVTQDGSISPT